MAKKKKTVKTDPKMWRALEKACEIFRSIWVTQRMRKGLSNYRTHNASTKVDYLIDFELMIRKLYPEPQGRASFWRYIWSKPIQGEDGKVYKQGSEAFAVRVGSECIQRHIGPEYFRHVIRTGAKDKSAVKDDLQKLEGIVQRYNRLRREYQLKHGKHEPEPDCFQEIQEPETETETEETHIESYESTEGTEKPPSLDDPFANQREEA